MASNKEIIEQAINKAISADEPVNLLLISKALDDINGEVISSDTDYGMHYNFLYIGMSGQRMVDQMNSNWKATDAQFAAHNSELEIRIMSNQIKEIKVENDTPYYTLDGKTWTSLQGSWGKISGDIANQTDLQNVLSDKVSQSDFILLKTSVKTNTDDIFTLSNNLTTLANTVGNLNTEVFGTHGLSNRMTDAEESLRNKISSETVQQIRTVNNTALEFTMDGGTTWHPVSSAGQVEWGDIIGDINNQADLKNRLDTINGAFQSLLSTVVNHISITNGNPHGVTKDYVGLHNVDNTADVNKPLSTPQKTYIDEQISNIKVKVTDYNTYINTYNDAELKATLSEDTIYIAPNIQTIQPD